MGRTNIEWADFTFNIAWGCTKVSAGCRSCYADTFAHRIGLDVWGPNKPRRTFGAKHWREPLAWNAVAERAGERRRVFCSSMADVFEDHPTLAQERVKLWPLIRATPSLDWLLLTKRPENFRTMLPADWGEGFANVWLGTTAEDQENADRRVPLLLQTPAAMRFLSCEPLLGPIDMTAVHPRVDWVIVGGESGSGARPCDVAWIRSLVAQSSAAGVATFVKQLGRHPVIEPAGGDRAHPGYRSTGWVDPGAGLAFHAGHLHLRDPKGGNPAEWPEDLRVREFPDGARSATR